MVKKKAEVDVPHVEPELPGISGDQGHVADHRPDCYVEGEKIVIRASSIGSCTRRLIGQGLGMDGEAPPAKIVGKWNESAALEDAVLAAGKKAIEEGTRCRYKRLEVTELTAPGGIASPMRPYQGQWEFDWEIGERAVLRGHLDELVSIYEQERGGYLGKAFIEAKAFGDSYWEKWLKSGWDAFPGYAWQFSACSHALGLPGWMVVAHKIDGEIAEVDVRWVEQGDTPVRRGQLMARVVGVAGAVARGEMPDACDQKDWPCPLWYLHEDVQEELVEVEDPAIVEVAREYLGLKDDAAKIKSRMDEIRGLLFEELEKGVKYNAGGVRVLLSEAVMEEQTRTVKAHTRKTLKVEEV